MLITKMTGPDLGKELLAREHQDQHTVHVVEPAHTNVLLGVTLTRETYIISSFRDWRELLGALRMMAPRLTEFPDNAAEMNFAQVLIACLDDLEGKLHKGPPHGPR